MAVKNGAAAQLLEPRYRQDHVVDGEERIESRPPPEARTLVVEACEDERVEPAQKSEVPDREIGNVAADEIDFRLNERSLTGCVLRLDGDHLPQAAEQGEEVQGLGEEEQPARFQPADD